MLAKVPSKLGMFFMYALALVISTVFLRFAVADALGAANTLSGPLLHRLVTHRVTVAAMLWLHFAKRELEVRMPASCAARSCKFCRCGCAFVDAAYTFSHTPCCRQLLLSTVSLFTFRQTLFFHRFSGNMEVGTSALVCFFYGLTTFLVRSPELDAFTTQHA